MEASDGSPERTRKGYMALHTDSIRDELAGPLAEAGLVVEEVRAHAAGRHRTLTVVIDLDADHSDPVPFDTVTEATRTVSEVLDGIEVWGEHPYTLEVTSPGAERPLTEPRHFRRARGRRVHAELRAEEGAPNSGETVEGVLTDADAAGIVLDGVRDGDRIPFAEVAAARVVVSLR
ncbi:ribosome maturation factor RimP [Brevibacterium sp. Mu109]|nr:ribosome maturation factor RimP [Brevibacterium sp. Mu109]